jgi:hypothetical protein
MELYHDVCRLSHGGRGRKPHKPTFRRQSTFLDGMKGRSHGEEREGEICT